MNHVTVFMAEHTTLGLEIIYLVCCFQFKLLLILIWQSCRRNCGEAQTCFMEKQYMHVYTVFKSNSLTLVIVLIFNMCLLWLA